ncbi:GMC oxidoreductase-like protein [Thozetella sp. PMI_491]|nr:GMC oxidoreductase-like protein [Thozetella sp. PMI_491]
MAILRTLLVSSLAASAGALPFRSVKREVSQLRDKYDFIIAGGGTSGLTVADRLTEAFPNKTVLVIEYGDVEYAPGIFDPPQIVWGGRGAAASSWTFASVPNPLVSNQSASVLAGKVVGGSSAINGMFFDRGSRYDFDAWTQAGSPEFDSSKHKWDWDGIFPYFKKSVTFTEPSQEVAKKYGYTWNVSAYGGSTPIYSSYPPFLWADYGVARDAWREMGIYVRPECAAGEKDALCWVPISEHPVTSRRSHAGLGHYAAVNATRPNYDLLVKHQVTRVLYPDGLTRGPPTVEVRSLADNRLFNQTPRAEVIISAGALHTPTILHRSGIGPASVLKAHGIPLVLDLPGVGSNLQDHSGASITWNYSKPLSLFPLPEDMNNATFAADAAAGFDETPARGPYTLAMSNSAMFVPLPNVTVDYMVIIDKIRSLAGDAAAAAAYLPPDYRSDPTMVAGYQHQLAVHAKFLAHPKYPSIESGWAVSAFHQTGFSVRAINLHLLSRGTVRLNSTSPLEQPILDYRTGTNPVDFDIYLTHLRYLRRMVGTPSMQKLGAVETAPGVNVTSDADLIQYIRDKITLSFLHPCCTAAMIPKAKGGVVGPDLKVHGAAGLRVVDMSILPILPSSHLSALAYAVGEKAADIVIQEWSKTKSPEKLSLPVPSSGPARVGW